MIVRKSGPIFSTAAKGIVNDQVEAGVAGAQGHLARAIQANAPVLTGETRSRVLPRGVGLQRTVAVDLKRVVPLEFGWMPPATRAALAAAQNTYRLKGKRKLVRQLKARKVAGKKFVYGTFDRLHPQLTAMYLAPVGAGIVQALGGT